MSATGTIIPEKTQSQMVLLTLPLGVGSTSLVNAAVVVLVIVFLTMPTIFVLAEFLRRRRPNPAPEQASPALPAVDANLHASDATLSTNGHGRPPTPRGLRTIASNTVDHDFTRESVPQEIGWIGADDRFDGAVVFPGHLQLARRVRGVGDVEASGSIALSDGVYVLGDVRAGGNVYLGGGATVTGHVEAGGNAFLSSWARVQSIQAVGDVEMEAGAKVAGRLEAGRLFKVDSVTNPRLKSQAPPVEADAAVPT